MARQEPTEKKVADTEPMAEKELNLDQKVTIKSIADWNTSFAYITTIGEALIPPEGTLRISRNEIIAQVQSGRKLFTGIDGQGSHATYYIDDPDTRRFLEFDSADGKTRQIILDDKTIARIFDIKSKNEFEKTFTEMVQTRAEKKAIIRAIKRLGINDYYKIKFAEKYTGMTVD